MTPDDYIPSWLLVAVSLTTVTLVAASVVYIVTLYVGKDDV